MSAPRREIIRPPTPPQDHARRQQQLQKIRIKLDKERETLARWQKRLRRAFNAVENALIRYLLCHTCATVARGGWDV